LARRELFAAITGRGQVATNPVLDYEFAVMVWLLNTGNPVGGLIIVPILAIWMRRTAEAARFTSFARRFAKPS
jgi:hypothetical protein